MSVANINKLHFWYNWFYNAALILLMRQNTLNLKWSWPRKKFRLRISSKLTTRIYFQVVMVHSLPTQKSTTSIKIAIFYQDFANGVHALSCLWTTRSVMVTRRIRAGQQIQLKLPQTLYSKYLKGYFFPFFFQIYWGIRI